MRPDPLRPSPRELEEQLARRSCPEPGADFRARVLGGMADTRDRPVVGHPPSRWRFVWRVAAAVILALNLGMSVANGLRFQRVTTSAVAPVGVEGWAARARVPEVFDAEERFQRLAASAVAGLTPAPDVGVLTRTFFSTEEEREWDMP